MNTENYREGFSTNGCTEGHSNACLPRGTEPARDQPGRADKVRTGARRFSKKALGNFRRAGRLIYPITKFFFAQLLTLCAFPIYDVEELGLRE